MWPIHRARMNVDNRMEEERYPASCRDKGWMWSGEGALCLSWWQHDASGFREANRSHPTQDKHKAPHPPHSTPCPYRTGNVHDLIRLSTFIRVPHPFTIPL